MRNKIIPAKGNYIEFADKGSEKRKSAFYKAKNAVCHPHGMENGVSRFHCKERRVKIIKLRHILY